MIAADPEYLQGLANLAQVFAEDPKYDVEVLPVIGGRGLAYAAIDRQTRQTAVGRGEDVGKAQTALLWAVGLMGEG